MNGGFSLGDDLVDKLCAQKLGDELPCRARDRHTLDPLGRDTGEYFGQDIQRGLQGLPLGAGVMFFNHLLLFIDQNCIGTYRPNIQP